MAPHLLTVISGWLIGRQCELIFSCALSTMQVGPRFCLDPIKIFAGSFGGPTLFSNPSYVSPNQVRFFSFFMRCTPGSRYYRLIAPASPHDQAFRALTALIVFSNL